MSGTPNMQDIALLHAALAEVDAERAKIGQAENQKQHYQLCIDEAEQRLRKHQTEVKRLMEAMDCASPGNHGYENRLMALLTGLSRVGGRSDG